MVRALVTGANGFLGSHLVRSLVGEGYQVRAFVHASRPVSDWNSSVVETVKGDLLDRQAVEQAVRGMDVVFHCAAVLPGGDNEEHAWKVNVTGTQYLVESCLQHGVGRLVYVSSDSVYGDDHSDGAKEDAPLNPQYFTEGNYPLSKLEGERLALNAFREHGLPVVALRPCLIYGPGHGPSTETLRQWARGPVKLLLGGGRSRLSIIFVEDLAAALILAANRTEAVGKTYNISDGGAYSKREIVDLLRQLTGRPKLIVGIPGGPVYLALRLAGPFARVFAPGSEDRFDPRRVTFATSDHVIDSTKAMDELGFHPRVQLREGLARTAAWWSGNAGGLDR